MPQLIPTPAIKKASSEDLIATMNKISRVLLERDLNSEENLDDMFKVLLNDKVFGSMKDIREPLPATGNMIAIPSMMPRKDSKGQTKGDSVVPLIQIPGEEPYYGYLEDTETYVDKRTINYRGKRSITLHKVIPGMIVSFHHYTDDGDNHRPRTSIDVTRIMYDDNNEMVFEALSEVDGLVNMPDSNSGRQI